LAAHRARCGICKHPECEEIEREFLDWVSPREIAENWKLASYRAIYRHAHAVGLFERRRKNRLAALEAIIERVREVPVTASAVVAAIRLSMELEGERDEPEPKFRWSLEGLPRTNAVTGVAPGDEGALQRAPAGGDGAGGSDQLSRPAGADAACDELGAEGHSLESAPTAGSVDSGLEISEGMRAAHALPRPTEEGQRLKNALLRRQGIASDLGSGTRVTRPADHASAKARADLAAEGARIVSGEIDPRIVLGEDGRVAGIPWPKQKITFARFARRWRERGP
jgi:hypothetical protein